MGLERRKRNIKNTNKQIRFFPYTKYNNAIVIYSQYIYDDICKRESKTTLITYPKKTITVYY